MRTYETVIVIDSFLKNEEIDEIVNKVERVISNNGGKIESIERWGKKRLAFEIKRRQYGYYVEIVFEAPPNVIRILEREYRLEENILRYLSIYLDKRALEYRDKQKLNQEDIENVKAGLENKSETTEDKLNEVKKEKFAIPEAESSIVVKPSLETGNVEK